MTPKTKKEIQAEKLAASVWKSLERDAGRHTALFLGVDSAEVSKMSDEQLIAWSKLKPAPIKYCTECGHEL